MSVLKELVGKRTHSPELEQYRRSYEAYCEYAHHGRWKPCRHLHLVCE